MNDLISFASAIADPLRLRLVSLALARKVTPSDAGSVLKLAPAELANQLKLLTDIGLLKSDSKGGFVRVKKKHQDLVTVLFMHFSVSAKKDPVLANDAKFAKHLRDARQRADKEARKSKNKIEPSGKKVKARKQKVAKTDKKTKKEGKAGA